MKKTMKIMLATVLSVLLLAVFATATEDMPTDVTADNAATEDVLLIEEPVAEDAETEAADDNAAPEYAESGETAVPENAETETVEDSVVTEMKSVYNVHSEDDVLAAFTDAPAKDNWMYQGLNCAVTNEVMNGHNNLLRPTDKLTRAEMTAMMVRVLGAQSIKGDVSKYIDVASNQWYYDSIRSGVGVRIINGSGNKMMPNDAITREQTMAILARTFLFTAEKANASAAFSDRAAVSAWAKDAVNALIEAEVVLGDNNNAIRPKANITRAEFATMLDRIVCFFAKAGVDYSGATIKGSVIVNDANVDLSGATIEGDIYVVEAIDDAAIDLSDVDVDGRIVVRSGDVTVADGDENKVVNIEDVIPPEDTPVTPVVPNVPVVPNDKEIPDVGSTPNTGDKEKFAVDADGTYVSWGDAETKEYATANGNVLTFDLSGIGLNEELHALYVMANKNVAIESDGFYEVSFMTNEEYAVSDILIDMLDSTSRSISQMLGITDNAGNVTADRLTVGSLADKIETAYTFYTNDMSDDKWMQKLFDERGIICDEAADRASFVGTIGGKEYTIVLIVPELP